MPPPAPSARSLRLLLELGRGGMGVVYLALHQGPGGFTKLKVVKRLRPDLASEPAAVEMFLEEGRLSARLHHPNVVQTNEVGFDGKHYFLEMEYLEGQTLEALTRRANAGDRGGVDRAVAVWILSQALAGLHYAHELADHNGAPLKVVHRDVSPHNVFVTYDGQVKVLDFGIAKAADSQHETQTGVLKGKVTYMAPEQVARKGLDRRADVFAAGVILWQILSGERLWKDLDDFEIFLKLRSEDIPPPSSVRGDVPEALETACKRALARKPEERTPTAAEMQRELEAWLETSGSRVGPREVAAQMDALFAADKAETKSEIDERIRTTPADASVVGVPMLRVPSSRGTASEMITADSLAVDGTRVRQQKQIRGLRTVAMGAMGIAVVASLGASFVTVRARRARALAEADAGAVSSLPDCTNRTCSESHGGEPWVCRASDHACVAVESQDCKAMYEKGDLVADDTVWLGAMFPMKGRAADTWGKMNMDGVDFARSDVARVTGQLGSTSTTSRVHRIAVVGCDDSEDAMRAARHMVDDVGVPAIIGFKSSAEIVNVASSLLIPRGVLTIASISPNPSIVRIPQPPDQPRMVWRTTINHESFAKATAHFIHEVLEPRRDKRDAPMRVALVHDDSAGSLAFATSFYKTLEFNGKSALDNGHDYAELSLKDAGVGDVETVGVQVASGTPDVAVLMASGSENELALTDIIEARVHRDVRPTYVLVNYPTSVLKPFIEAHPERRHRVFGVGQFTGSTPNARFVIRYNEARHASVTRDDNPGVSYDAFYLLAYSAFGAPSGAPITGAVLARGFAKLLPPGKPIEVGPNDTLEALGTLTSGAHLDLEGTQGGLDFDLTTGEAPWDVAFFCAGMDAHSHQTDDDVESGAIYRDATHHIEGTVRCP